jgi:hypothetical protein
LTRELELLQGRLAELQQILQGGDTQRLALEQQWAAATRRVVDLEVQNTDLAARLATAQIRRLEAEKDLIQVLIDGQRSGAPAVGPSSEAAPSTASGARP